MSSLVITENICLQAFNTLSIPVLGRWFVEVDNEQQLMQALAFRRQQQCALLILGGGSNIVLSQNFAGLVVKNNLRGRHVEDETSEHVFLSVMAGENWHDTVMYCVDHCYYGIENLALIPGSVGAAPIQNIGAYGVELAQSFHYLEAIRIDTGEKIIMNREQCQFAYRESVFKHEFDQQLIITRVVLVLSKIPQLKLDYPALQQALGGYSPSELTAKHIADAVIVIRQSKLPDPKEIPNAGSFFKNPIVDEPTFKRLKKQWPNIVAFPQHRHASGGEACYKLAAAWLIDNAGWKGKVVDGIHMHEQQALVLTNPLKLSGKRLLEFIGLLVKDIDRQYGIRLEVEPKIC